MKNIKEKVLKEAMFNAELYSLEQIVETAIDQTLAEVIKVINKWSKSQKYAKGDNFHLAVDKLKNQLKTK